MNFTCERPYAFYLLLLLIPALIITAVNYKNIFKNISFFSLKHNPSDTGRIKHFPIMLIFRSIFRTIAWIMLTCAFAGISWGSYLEPVQKSGSAVGLVFDISYSMTTQDASGGLDRLSAAKNYASILLSHIPNSAISVTLAKGDGINVIPLTEDRIVVDSLLDVLSPELMSAGGTSLGKGIRAALNSFPASSARANVIWVFTDGDETDGQLESALAEAVKKGVPVYLIGFGSENESRVLAGDKKTYVYTALRSEKLKKICSYISTKNSQKNSHQAKVFYIDATEVGSALKLLDYIEKTAPSMHTGNAENSNSENDFITYEVKPVKRYQLFLIFAIVFFVLGFFVSEINPESIISKFKKVSAASIILLPLFFTSCTNNINRYIKNAKTICISSLRYNQKKYNAAVAGFLQCATDAKIYEDDIVSNYATYNLASTYIMQNQNEAALERFQAVTPDAPSQVLFSTYYNKGIIAYKTGDYEKATQSFRQALKIDATKINAKINLELAISKYERELKSNENVTVQVQENKIPDTMQNAVFQRIKQNDKNQWKNSETTEKSSSSTDY